MDPKKEDLEVVEEEEEDSMMDQEMTLPIEEEVEDLWLLDLEVAMTEVAEAVLEVVIEAEAEEDLMMMEEEDSMMMEVEDLMMKEEEDLMMMVQDHSLQEVLEEEMDQEFWADLQEVVVLEEVVIDQEKDHLDQIREETILEEEDYSVEV